MLPGKTEGRRTEETESERHGKREIRGGKGEHRGPHSAKTRHDDKKTLDNQDREDDRYGTELSHHWDQRVEDEDVES